MPLYEYVCLNCGFRFETLRSMREADAPIECQKCASQRTSRLISVFNAQTSGRAVAGTSSNGCAGCSGGSCSTCGR